MEENLYVKEDVNIIKALNMVISKAYDASLDDIENNRKLKEAE